MQAVREGGARSEKRKEICKKMKKVLDKLKSA
jgi:hypothetical protein